MPAKRRPGAPPGNLNALKSGRRSKQVKALVFFLMAIPETRNVMLRLARLDAPGRQLALADLQDAIKWNARLLEAPSRQRSIAALRRALSPETLQLLKTMDLDAAHPDDAQPASDQAAKLQARQFAAADLYTASTNSSRHRPPAPHSRRDKMRGRFPRKHRRSM